MRDRAALGISILPQMRAARDTARICNTIEKTKNESSIEAELIRRQELLALAANRTPGYHYPEERDVVNRDMLRRDMVRRQ